MLYRTSFMFFVMISAQIAEPFNIAYQGFDAYESYESSWGKERFIKDDYIKYFAKCQMYTENLPFDNLTMLSIASLPLPYSQIGLVMPFNGYGIYFNSLYIEELFAQNSIKIVAEIGSSYGLSTRHIASCLPGDGIVYAIDEWNSSEHAYAQFLSNVILKGLTHKIIPIQSTSTAASQQLADQNVVLDMVYLDGNHETDAVLDDLEYFWPLLGQHGIMSGDDWLLSSVRTAILTFAYKHKLTVYGACNFWFLKKEGKFQVKDFLNHYQTAWKF